MNRLGISIPLIKYRYRNLVIADVPDNSFMFRLNFSTARKLFNLARIRRAYRQQQVTFKGRPVELRIDPTNVCNLRCPLCPTGASEHARKAGMMSTDTFERILERHYKDIFDIKLFVWGEPLLNPNLPAMVDMASRRGVGTEISTNLSVHLNDRTIEDLIRAGLTWLTASIDGTSSETYSQYRRGGKLELIEDNIQRIVACRDRLHSRTPFLEWQLIPFQHNEHEISSLVSKAKELGMDGARIKPLRLDKTQDGPDKPLMEDKQRLWLPKSQQLTHVQDLPGTSMLNMTCVFLWYQIAYHHDGGIAPCCEVFGDKNDFGNLDEDFQSIWQGPTYIRARQIALGTQVDGDKKQKLSQTYDPVDSCRYCTVFNKPRGTVSGFYGKMNE